MMSKSGSRIKIESESEIKTKIVVEQAEEIWRSHGHIVKVQKFFNARAYVHTIL